MSAETVNQELSGVSQTLLVTLYLRAMESQRPDALIKDEKAVELVTRMGHDFDRIRQIPMKEVNKVVPLLRNREFDRYARDFLARHPPDCLIGVSRRGGRDTTPHNRPKLSLPGGHNVPDVHWHTNKTVRGAIQKRWWFTSAAALIRASSASRSATARLNGMTWISRTSSSCAASSSAKNASAIISWPARRLRTPG
jgi:hypothetical protein